jgi:hypothetical protein
MPKLIELLNKNKMTLIVSLPENRLELAQAAISGGADALQLNIKLGEFKEFKDEKKYLEEIIDNSSVPVGISADWEEQPGIKHFKEILGTGFDFLNVGIEYLSPSLLALDQVSKILMLNSRYALDDVVELSASHFSAMDAAIIPTSGWGKDLIVGDLQNYISIVLAAGIPVIIPTQRLIRPSEVAIIADTGARGILLTPVVTGSSPKHIKQNVRDFRVAVDDLG